MRRFGALALLVGVIAGLSTFSMSTPAQAQCMSPYGRRCEVRRDSFRRIEHRRAAIRRFERARRFGY